jgi:hypothetical protein
MPRLAWSVQRRELLYKRVLNAFGPYSVWPPGPRGGDPHRPIGREAEFEQLLRDLAVEFGGEAEQWEAVWQQFKWGVTRQGPVVHPNMFRTMVLNKAAALQVGFLTGRDMPTNATLVFEPREVDDPDAFQDEQ